MSSTNKKLVTGVKSGLGKYIYEKTAIKNFLIGESLLKSDKPEELMKKLIQITQGNLLVMP